MIQILLALVAGILTIAAPCILLPLPIILGGSIGQNSKTRPLFITLGFVVSFASVALLINTLVQTLGLDPSALRTGAVVLLVLFAGFMIWPTPFEKLMTHMSGLINKASSTGQSAGSGNWGGFILGLIIGIIWAPCAGPILGSILTLIALEQNLGQASVLLIAYAIGAGLPMLAIAYGGQALTTKVKALARYSTRLQQVFGVLLIGLAAAIYFQYDTVIQTKIVEKFPGLGTGFEKSLIENFESNNENTNSTNSETNNSGDTSQVQLKNLGPAPEFTGISNWLNSKPLTMAALKGKVVLVDFWTYSCINCIRTLPHITKLHADYAQQGLVIVGVHTPEFAFEKSTENVQTALKRHNIQYPIAQDNDFGTWNAFRNRYWPAKYLIDQSGNIVYTHFGEGNYEETEQVIRQLLGLEVAGSESTTAQEKPNQARTPEIYFGTSRLENLTVSQTAKAIPTDYVIPNRLDLNAFALEGKWQFDGEEAKLIRGPGKIKLHFYASEVNFVAESSPGQTITVKVGNMPSQIINISEPKLYNLYSSDSASQQVLEISIPDGGLNAFTFTFG